MASRKPEKELNKVFRHYCCVANYVRQKKKKSLWKLRNELEITGSTKNVNVFQMNCKLPQDQI